jgi:hypothetical protein
MVVFGRVSMSVGYVQMKWLKVALLRIDGLMEPL